MRALRILVLSFLIGTIALFVVPPLFLTGMRMFRPDQVLTITPEVLAKLISLRNRPKYVILPGTIYNGMRPETNRVRAEMQVNDLIERLITSLQRFPSKAHFFSEVSKTLYQFEPIDTEDREQLVRYVEELMDALEIETSDALLNQWLYGALLAVVLEFDRTKR
jgi:hypothetical protein